MNILELNIQRTSKGLKIKAKSDFFEDYFESADIPVIRGTGMFTGFDVYNVRNRIFIDGVLDYSRFFFNDYGNKIIPSLAFLTVKGLKKGIEFMVPGIIVNNDQLQKVTTKIDTQVRKLYADLNAESKLEMIIVDETV